MNKKGGAVSTAPPLFCSFVFRSVALHMAPYINNLKFTAMYKDSILIFCLYALAFVLLFLLWWGFGFMALAFGLVLCALFCFFIR